MEHRGGEEPARRCEVRARMPGVKASAAVGYAVTFDDDAT
jgi:hypothetical protein